MEEDKKNTTQEISSAYLSPDKFEPTRKSLIFHKKSGCVTDTNFSIVCDETDTESQYSAGGYDLDVGGYVQILKTELEDWKTLYKDRKQTFKGMKRKLKSKSYCDEIDVNNFLTEEDKKFLAERPDYERVGKEAVKSINRLIMCREEVRTTEVATVDLIGFTERATNVLGKFVIEKSCIFNEI